MASNSFLIKGWSLTVASGLVGFAIKDGLPWIALAGTVPTICFWSLDSYYLRQERLFRKLYDAVRANFPEPPQGLGPFTMDTRGFDRDVASTFRILFSKTSWPIYAPQALGLIATAIVLFVR